MINNELLEILACPQCKGPVTLDSDRCVITCDACKLMYEIKDDIPIMLIDKAVKIED
jgi:uncharacterized protein YbaR (Trm112 family)